MRFTIPSIESNALVAVRGPRNGLYSAVIRLWSAPSLEDPPTLYPVWQEGSEFMSV